MTRPTAYVGFKRAYSLREAAEVLNISVPFAYRLARRKALPGAFRLGGRWLFGRDAIDFLALNGQYPDDGGILARRWSIQRDLG